MTAQPCYPGGPWLWFPSICKETNEKCHLKKKKKNQGSELQVTLPRAHSCLDTGPVSAEDGKGTHRCAGDEETPCAAFEGGLFLTSS